MFMGENAVLCGIAVYYHEYTKKKPIFVPGRSYHSLTFRLSGKITVEKTEKAGNGESTRLVSGAGCLTFIPAGMSYVTEVLEDGAMYTVTYLTKGDAPDGGAKVLRPVYSLPFRNVFSSLFERFRAGRERDFACFSMFYDILAKAEAEAKSDFVRLIPKRLWDAKKAIDTGFNDSTLSVGTLAESCGISDVYFRKTFRDSFGTSPSDYIRKVRIDNAKLLLRTGFYSVSEVAVRCGFDSISYFSYAFGKTEGISPKEYMNRFEVT